VAVKQHIFLFFIAIFISSGYGYAQKIPEKSRLNVGQNPKKAIFQSSNTYLLIKNTLPKEISFNTKSSFTDFYRNLLIINNNTTAIKGQNSSALTSETSSERAAKGEKILLSNIYPNPANDFATLDLKIVGNFNSANVGFFNLLGKQISEFEINKNTDKLRINTSSWESGIYMYQLVVDGKKIATKKLLVRHN
jgi:Secretion system C-terminal sorting domain